MSHIQLLPFRGSLAIEGDPQGSQPNQKRELQRAVGAQRSGRQEEISPRREALVGLSGWLVALGICCCTRAFSLVVARRGSSLVAAHLLRLLHWQAVSLPLCHLESPAIDQGVAIMVHPYC